MSWSEQYPPVALGRGGRIKRCSCVHRAQNRLTPNRLRQDPAWIGPRRAHQPERARSLKPQVRHHGQLLEPDRLPADRVPYWDFEAPDIPRAPRDASAAAIAAAGLAELGRLTAGERGAGYRRAAQDILASLASNYLTLGTPNQAVLTHSVGSFRQDSEVDVGLVYADYYLLEAISRLHRQ